MLAAPQDDIYIYIYIYMYIYIYIYVYIYIYKHDLALNDQHLLMCHKIQSTNQRITHMFVCLSKRARDEERDIVISILII